MKITGNWWLRLPRWGRSQGVPEPVCTDSFSWCSTGSATTRSPWSSSSHGHAPAAGWPSGDFRPGSATPCSALRSTSPPCSLPWIRNGHHPAGLSARLGPREHPDRLPGLKLRHVSSAGGPLDDANNDGLIVSDEGSQVRWSERRAPDPSPVAPDRGRPAFSSSARSGSIDVDHDGIRDLIRPHLLRPAHPLARPSACCCSPCRADIRAASFTGIGGRADPASTPVGRSAVGLALARRSNHRSSIRRGAVDHRPRRRSRGFRPTSTRTAERDVPPLVNTMRAHFRSRCCSKASIGSATSAAPRSPLT